MHEVHFTPQEILEIGKLINLRSLSGRSIGTVLEGVLEKIDAWLDERENN